VLSGANLPPEQDEHGLPRPSDGILTAEAIAAMPLDDLELAVLSACETGLGDMAAGEGAFGLQRAFHLAGARNVVASLWKVDDNATAALMNLFYHKLWQENKPPIVALRESQLAIYHHPEQIGALAGARGLDLSNTMKLVDEQAADSNAAKAATRLWAGFVLSGARR
jgi:CHAT domain-containing protein